MNKKEPRIVWLAGLVASLMAALAVGGCTGETENDLGMFVGDLLRSALAAYLF